MQFGFCLFCRSSPHDGVQLYDITTVGNKILGNAIYSNSRLGINLAGGSENSAGMTTNDTGDADTGPNNLQNYPVLTAATVSGGNTTVTGSLNSRPNTAYRIDFYLNNVADVNAEGKSLVGSIRR